MGSTLEQIYPKLTNLRTRLKLRPAAPDGLHYDPAIEGGITSLADPAHAGGGRYQLRIRAPYALVILPGWDANRYVPDGFVKGTGPWANACVVDMGVAGLVTWIETDKVIAADGGYIGVTLARGSTLIANPTWQVGESTIELIHEALLGQDQFGCAFPFTP